MEHIIYNIDLFISNSKSLDKLRPKKQYFGRLRRQQFRLNPIKPSILLSNNEKYYYYRIIVKHSNFTRSSIEHYDEDTPITI